MNTFYYKTMFTQALINGEKVVYDGCTDKPLIQAKTFYTEDKWAYIGSSNITYHNGVENIWPREKHFFVSKY